ncbi:predicted protein [Scheffersomyces stipitis CBS 6054]|uniref:Protein ECM7 n=1 Tax=Scheffersomyces stipitis (strain ATCC 58785 / CBS 6054 / NBRC 10063 / NRRL Y-11545) TaxID=322104 RepID=A3LST1_PICST|nr:predicted protein [Scheffersomyces stipitis CBS 6054]ABN65947.2 predicted protein [Scheffersomyces stipitis CBS 6054]
MLSWRNLRYHILTPFKNLTVQERILQTLRLFAACSTIAYTIALLGAPFLSNKIYLSRIDCAHLDVAYGLYKSLRNSVTVSPEVFEESGAAAFPVDSTLTNSEITLLSQYAESQVASAPQFIVTSLWSWCYGNYDSTQYYNKYGEMKVKKHNVVMVCSDIPTEYVFNYREELQQIGLSSILAYAYQSANYEDEHYTDVVKLRHHRYNLVAAALTFCGASQLILLILMVIMYQTRGKEKDLSKHPQILNHLVALTSVASCISVCVGTGIIFTMLKQIQSEIAENLGDFGVTFHLGKAWFALLWLCTSFSVVSMLLWVLPLWCANPTDDYEEDLEVDFLKQAKSRRSLYDGKLNFMVRMGSKKSNNSEGRGLMSDNEANENKVESAFPNRHTEEELRKLGESISTNHPVRRTKSRVKRNQDDQEVPQDQAKDLLYNDVSIQQYSNYPTNDFLHYREETYDGYKEGETILSRKGTSLSRNKMTRKLQNPKAQLNVNENRLSTAGSFLNDDELQYLDSNNFIGKY